MRKISKLLCLLLTLVLCLSFAACGKNDNSGDNSALGGNESGDDTAISIDSVESFDMGGMKVRMAGFYGRMPTTDGTPTTEKDIARWEQVKAIEEKFNCKFENILFAEQYIVNQTVSTYQLGGEVLSELFCCFFDGARNLARDGQCKAIGDYVDTSRPQWNDVVTELGTIDGKIFTISEDIPNVESMVSFLPKYVDEYGLEDPYELIAQGKWTTDKYLEMVRAATSHGAKDNVYGTNRITSDPYMTPYLLMFGTEWVSVDENGIYSQNLDDPKMLEALNYLGEINKCAPPANAENAKVVFAYPTGNAGLPQVASRDPNLDQYYFCESPRSPYITEAVNYTQSANVIAMQKAVDEEIAKQVGVVFGLIHEPLGGNMETHNEIERRFWQGQCYNEESCDTILALREKGPKIATWHMGGFDVWTLSKAVGACYSGSGTIASVLASYKDMWVGYCDEKNAANDK